MGKAIRWKSLRNAGQLSAYKHLGFWHPMDTLRDKNKPSRELWGSGNAPWKVLVTLIWVQNGRKMICIQMYADFAEIS